MNKFLIKLFSFIVFFAAYSVAMFMLISGWDDSFWTAYVFAALIIIAAAVYTLLVDRGLYTRYAYGKILYSLLVYVGLALIMNTLFAVFHLEYSFVVPLICNLALVAPFVLCVWLLIKYQTNDAGVNK